MTATRDIVTDKREQFAFHDDIAYLRETKRGLTRATVEEISGFKQAALVLAPSVSLALRPMRTTTIAAASDKATILRWVVRPAPRSEWCIAVSVKSRS